MAVFPAHVVKILFWPACAFVQMVSEKRQSVFLILCFLFFIYIYSCMNDAW